MDRTEIMNEITERMANRELTPLEGWHCLKAVARHMTEKEKGEDMAYIRGFLDYVSRFDHCND